MDTMNNLKASFFEALSSARALEEKINEKIRNFLYIQVRRSSRSHFCFFLLFLISGRNG